MKSFARHLTSQILVIIHRPGHHHVISSLLRSPVQRQCVQQQLTVIAGASAWVQSCLFGSLMEVYRFLRSSDRKIWEGAALHVSFQAGYEPSHLKIVSLLLYLLMKVRDTGHLIETANL